MKPLPFINALLISLFLTAGCSTSEAPPQPEPMEKDPLEAAREKLFSEIGIENAEAVEKSAEPELPSVLPTPPVLPATDSDLSELPVK